MQLLLNSVFIAAACSIVLFFLVSMAHFYSKGKYFTANIALSLIGVGLALAGLGILGSEFVAPASVNHLLNIGLGLFGLIYGGNLLVGCARNWRLQKQLRDQLRDKSDGKNS